MKKLFHFAFLAIILGSFAVQAETKNAVEKPYKEISAEELQVLIAENAETVIVDTRGAKYFDGTVIKGSKVLAVNDITAESLAAIAPNKEAPLVLYCQNLECPASAKAAHKAKELGYTNILKYPGGIEEWVEKKLPSETIAK
jgi:rhodanese-related sulfurtransferase